MQLESKNVCTWSFEPVCVHPLKLILKHNGERWKCSTEILKEELPRRADKETDTKRAHEQDTHIPLARMNIPGHYLCQTELCRGTRYQWGICS